MARYLVSYDLKRVRNYARLIPDLRSAGAVSPVESVWLLDHSGSASVLMSQLQASADGDDGFFVVNMEDPTDWAVTGLTDQPIKWMIARFGGARY